MGNKIRFGILTAIFFVFGTRFGGSYPAYAGGEAGFTSVRVGHEFGNYIRFRVQVDSADPVQQVFVFFRDERESYTRTEPMSLENGEYIYVYDASDNYLHPFARLSLHFEARFENGATIRSDDYSYVYSDNRFTWQTREENNLRVHWSEGDERFGQSALDSARNGLRKIESFFPADLTEPVDIYIYASPVDLQNALFLGGESWVAGHADPALGTVFVSVAPGTEALIAMQQEIPHELAHVLLYRYIGEGYTQQPTWLLEGMSTLVELYPNPDYALALERAVDEHTLIPISDLCDGFPRDASQAFLSYAEAVSFTRSLRESYGMTQFDALILKYADGIACDEAVEQVYGQSLKYLDARWQESELGANLLGVAFRATAPYLLILAIFLAYPAAQYFAIRPIRIKDGS